MSRRRYGQQPDVDCVRLGRRWWQPWITSARLRGVERVSLVAWSLGGPRSGGYAARNPQKSSRLVLLAPGYNREGRGRRQPRFRRMGVVFNTQSRAEFDANWDRQVGCPAQCEKAAADGVWSAMIASDPVGATWGTGVRRAPQTTSWGWNAAVVTKTQTPTLMVAGIHDKQVVPDRVKELYDDLGASGEGDDRSWLLLAQRDVGEEPYDAVPRVARVAREGHRERVVDRRSSDWDTSRVPVRGRDHRKADHAVDDLFVDRWSPRAMSGEPSRTQRFPVLFEAARWAPSAGNTPSLAHPLRTSRHGAVAALLRPAGRAQSGLVPQRGRAPALHLAHDE